MSWRNGGYLAGDPESSVSNRSWRYNHRVPRPLSKSALERLGRRLVASDPPRRADIEQLHVLLAAYGPVLSSAVDRVSEEVGLIPSSRVKTTSTIMEKLRRNGGHTLSSIHDLAGMRLVVPGGRAAQDQMAERIRGVFMDGVRAPRTIDRRLEPVQGYRAVHVIVYPDGYPIEVQVRTEWQHMWAEWFERVADQYGRGIRYGDPPVRGGDSAGKMVESMIRMADQIAEAEESGSTPPLSAVGLALAVGVLQWLSERRAEQ
ncbi:MAG: RelA/SpoT domain-containing protein [Solirubrobacteraceae bacterium]